MADEDKLVDSIIARLLEVRGSGSIEGDRLLGAGIEGLRLISD